MRYFLKHFSSLANNPLTVLDGCVITRVYKTRDGKYFGFDTNRGRFAFHIFGTCCSTSWLENIDVLAKLPATVLEINGNAEADLKGEGADRGRFIKIKTNRGYIDIDGRNDGGSTGMYSFEYELVVTEALYTMCAEKVAIEGDWDEFNKTAWDYAPGFNPKKWEGFAEGSWIEVR